MEKSVFTEEYAVFLRHLRKLRQTQGLTQVQLAERLHETQSWVSKCERGEHRLDVMELRKICLAMGVPMMEFIEKLEAALDQAK